MARHNIWIQCARAAAKGEAVRCYLYYGHYLEPDGQAEAARVRWWVAAPSREPEALRPAASGQALAAAFTPDTHGVYTLLATYDRGLFTVTRDGRWLPGAAAHPGEEVARTVELCYFAKRLVFVDATEPWPGSFAQELEIVPFKPERDELTVLVQHRGRPLPGAQVWAHCQGKPRTRLAVTDMHGKADFGLTPGEWLLLVRHEGRPAQADADARITNAVFGLTWA